MDDTTAEYDEFALLDRKVARHSFDVGSGRSMSALVWGEGEPQVVLLHGRGQNAHTWDGVATALDVPLVAVDLPGHGHSDWREDHDYGAWPNADAVAAAMSSMATRAEVVVGMSLGAMTNIALAARYPHLVRRAVIIDTTPVNRQERSPLSRAQQGAVALLDGPATFSSFDEILQTTAATIPGRSVESLRVGVRHNARQLEDGRWAWRYDMTRPEGGGTPKNRTALWDDLASITMPVMFIRAGRSGRVIDEDVAAFLERQPDAWIETVTDSGHSVQSDQPVTLARLIEDFVSSTGPATTPK